MSDYEEDFESPAREGGSDAEEYASDDFEGGVPRRALARSAVLESTRSRSMGGSGAQLLASGRAVPAPKGMRSSMRIVTQQDLKRAAQAEEWKEAAWSKLYATQRTKRKSNRATDTEASKKEYFDRVSKPKIRFEAGLALNCPLGQPEARLTRVHRRGGGLAKADDRRHCTFRPRISSKASEMVGEQQDFVGRMEAKEAEKRRALEQRRQREAYEARLDKKVCPRCRATQTFAEYADNKKHCSTCNVEFRPGRAWGDVQRSFIKRLEEGEKKKQRKLKELERTIATEKYPFAPKKREGKASEELPDAAATM